MSSYIYIYICIGAMVVLILIICPLLTIICSLLDVIMFYCSTAYPKLYQLIQLGY